MPSKSSRPSVPPASNNTASSRGRSGMRDLLREHHAAAVESVGLSEVAPHGFRVEPVLRGVNALLERLEGVVVADLDRALSDDRAAVDVIGDDVHRAAGD